VAYGRPQISGGRFRPQAWPPLSAVSDNCLGTQRSALWPQRRVVVQRQTQIVCRYSTPPACTAQAATRRQFEIRSQRRARSVRYKDGSSGGAASCFLKNSLYKYRCSCYLEASCTAIGDSIKSELACHYIKFSIILRIFYRHKTETLHFHF